MRDNVELVRVELLLGVRPMTAEEREEQGDPFFDEEEDGAVSYALDDIAEGIASLFDGESEYAREALAGSNHFVTIVSARAGNVEFAGDEARAA